MEADAAMEKRKLEKKVKEAEELKEGKKKKKKNDDKGASGSKDKPEDHDVGVSVKHDHVRRGKVFHYSGNPVSSSGRMDSNANVDPDLTDTMSLVTKTS